MVLRILWIFSLKHVKNTKRSYGFLGSSKAQVVDENTLRTIPGSDLVCVPNLVVVSAAFLAKNINRETDKQTDRHPINLIY